MWYAVGSADNPSDLYHQHGIREQECTRAEYSGKEIILHVKTKKSMFYCTKCGSKHVIRSGTVTRDFKSVPVGGKPVIIRMKVAEAERKASSLAFPKCSNLTEGKVQRLECKDCGPMCVTRKFYFDNFQKS